MSPGQSVVEEPASMRPEDAMATTADTEVKGGNIIPEEERMDVFASEPEVEKLEKEVDGSDDVPKAKDLAGEEGEGDGFVKRPVNPAIAKTSLCSYFRKKGCNHGENCKFAHGESELQPRPDGTWDPTSERCKKPVDKEENEAEESRYRKCLVNVPMNWSQQKLKSFLDENVSALSSGNSERI